VSEEKAKASAVRLARVVEINPKAYAAKVAGAGKDAFVLAIVLRMDAPRSAHAARGSVPFQERFPIRTSQMLAPARDFCPADHWNRRRSNKGGCRAGQAARSFPGIRSGCPGLQKRYDAQMRGTPGCTGAIGRRQAKRQLGQPDTNCPHLQPKPNQSCSSRSSQCQGNR
jgi:hypothetical protein